MKVKVICWDGVEYFREADEDEVWSVAKSGDLQGHGTDYVFNFKKPTEDINLCVADA